MPMTKRTRYGASIFEVIPPKRKRSTRVTKPKAQRPRMQCVEDHKQHLTRGRYRCSSFTRRRCKKCAAAVCFGCLDHHIRLGCFEMDLKKVGR